MGDQNVFSGPRKDPPEPVARRCPVSERQPELAGNRGFSRHHQVKPGDDGPPSGEPSLWKLLQQIGKNGGPAGAVEKDGLGGDPVAAHQHHVDFAFPSGQRCVVDLACEGDIGALFTQAGRGEDGSVRAGAVPVGEEAVMQAVRRDQVADTAQSVDRGTGFGAERDGRPQHKIAVFQADNGHAGGIVKPGGCGHDGAVSDPDFRPEFGEHGIFPNLYTCINLYYCVFMTSLKRTDRSRAQILDAADAAFRQSGYDGTSVEEIAVRAGLTRKTVYNLFGSKEEIALSLIARAEAADAGYRARIAVNEDAIALVERVLTDSAQWCLAHPALARLALSPAERPSTAPPTDRPSFQGLVRDIVALGQKQGRIRRDETPELLALILLAVYGQAMLNALPHGAVSEAEIGRIVRLVVQGIGTQGSPHS